MKDIKIIENIIRDDKNLITTCRITISYFPVKDSLKMNIFEHSFSITDLELVTNIASDMFNMMRLDSATSVFRDYYKSIFLK